MARRTSKRGVIEASSGNVFADLGLRDAEELDTKLRLTVEINHQRALTPMRRDGREVAGDG